MKIIDLFAGAGGMSKGFKISGFETVLAVEMNKDAINSFNQNIEPVAIQKNIKNFTIEEIKKYKNIIGIIGGPPCQGFSMAGKRIIEDERNNLFIDFIKFVRIIKPIFFVIENVKGLLSMKNGVYVKEIENRFKKMGYKIQKKVLSASDYGIPQNRDRVFFIGFKSKKEINFDFFPSPKNIKITTEQALSDLPLDSKKNDSNSYQTSPKNNFQKLMRKNTKSIIFNNERTNHTEKTIEIISNVPDGGGRKNLPNKFKNIRNFNASFNRMNSKSQSRTIDTGHRNYFHYSENRIPTVRESARIQSFPDDFFFAGSKTSQYRQVGNAVPPLMSKEIADNIKKIIQNI